jgi:PAS domain S-box-containing protein
MKIEMHEQIDDKSSKAFLERITIICTVLTIFISTITLSGWLFNLFDLTRSNPIYKPMSPSSALSFIVLGCSLLVYFYLPVNHTARKLAKVAVALILAFDLTIFVDFITGRGFVIERFILPYPETVNNIIIGWMSPIAAANFVISGFALLLLLFSPEGKRRTKGIAAYLACVSLYIGIIVFIGYFYGTPLFYGATTIPTSLFTAISFLFLSAGLLTSAGMEYLPLRLLIGDSVRARLMRAFIPVILAYIVLEGVLKIVLLPYSDENVLHSSIMVIFFFIFGGLITSRIAQTVGGDIDRKSLIQRERAADALRESESKFRTIFETIPDGLGLTRLKDGLLIEANNGLSQMFGYTLDELIGKTTRELNFWVDPDDRKKMIEQLQSRGFAYGMEVKYRKKNGEISTGTYSAAKLLINNELHLIISTKDISLRKRAENEREVAIIKAQIEKNKSEAIIAALGDGIIIQDTEYIITYQNKLQTEIYGEHAGEHCYKVYENRDTICEDCPVEKTFLDGNVHRTERSVPTGGKMSYYELTSSPLRDSSGKIIAGVKMVRDITDRKLSEEKLKLHEIRLEDMLKLHRLGDATEKEIFDFALEASLRAVQSDFAFIGLMTPDEAGMINHAWSKKVMSDCQISEKPVEYPIGQAGLWGEVVRQRRPIIINDYNMSKEFKKGYSQGHVPIKRFLGIPIISGTKIVAVACAANKTSDYTESDVSAFTSLNYEMWDILEHRRTEEEVSKNRAMLIKAQEIGHVGSWEWDLATNDLVWTKEIYSIYGLDPHKVQPKYDLVLNNMSPESKTEFLKAIDDALKLKKPFEMEYSLIRPDGSRSFVHTKGEVLFDSEGHPVTMFGMVQDITQRKVAEAERVKLIESEQKALAQVEAARKLDLMKSIFIASTSHELRTPLNSVIGFSSMLCEGYSGQLNPEQKEQLEIVHSSGKHLLTLINDIIDISKIEAGNINVELSEFKLGPIVDEAVSMLRVSLSEKKLDLKVNVQNIVMKSDRTRLFQCIVNLLSNAIKYTEKGSVEINVKVINNNVIITVDDTGIGIEIDDIPKLFNPFVRLQTPLTYKTSGTGLGLYLVKKLARDFLGGDVEVKSELGKGSKFTLRVPVEL